MYEIDPIKILEDLIIEDNKELLLKFVVSDNTVDLFGEETWDGEMISGS